jgi:hypothetical protein
MICGLLCGLGKKEAVLFSGDITSAFFLRVLLLLDVLLPEGLLFLIIAGFLAAGFFEAALLTIFFLLLSWRLS